MPVLSNALIEQAARFDPDRTLAASFADAPVRARLLTLLHFAHEIGRVREVVSEPHLGAIRLQWWRDVLDEIFDGRPVRRHEVAMALSQTISETPLPAALFHAMIDARSADFETNPFESWDALEAYCDATAGNLMRLSVLACGTGVMTQAMEQAVSRAGLAWAFSGLMRALPLWSSRRACFLPQQTLLKHRIDMEEIFAGRPTAALRSALREMADRAAAHQKAANTHLRDVPAIAMPAIAYASLAKPWAKTCLKLADPFRELPELLLLERQTRLVACVALKRL